MIKINVLNLIRMLLGCYKYAMIIVLISVAVCFNFIRKSFLKL